MATAKATLTLTPEELKIVQDALQAYYYAIDARIREDNTLPNKVWDMRVSIANQLYQKVVLLHQDLT